MGELLKRAAQHPAVPWTRYLVGLSAFGVSLYLMVTEKTAADRVHLIGHGALLTVGVLVIPGVFEPLFANAQRAVTLYREWKGGPPPANP